MQKKIFIVILAAALMTVLGMAGCQRIIKGPAPTPVEFESGTVEQDSLSVTMVITADEISKLDELDGLVAADLRGSECYQEIYAWSQAHPEVSVRYTVPLPNGSTVTNEIAALNMTELKHEDVEALIEAASCLPNLTSIELGKTREGFGWEDVAEICTAFPELKISYYGEVYGVEVSLDDTSLDLKYIPVEDGGETVRAALRCMTKLEYLDMDSCGLSDEEMAAIRDEFPDVKVVWRIWFGDSYSVRTDVERILASKPSVGGMLTPENTQSLKYCTDVKYLDVGHNESLTDISFVGYMPKLEVCILAMDWFSDLSPIANCTNMEYLEIQTTYITDISPLASLTNLEHLNICNLTEAELLDLSPLFGLSKLERLWIGGWTRVDREQVEELQKAIPDCEINTSAGDPTEGRWRYVDLNLDTWQYVLHPRYTELRKQFGNYADSAYSFSWNDPLYPDWLE
mgnify:CR=1 FL=1